MKPFPSNAQPLRLIFVVALVGVAMGAAGPCDSECSTDDDCHGTKICVDGSCVECESDNDCESNERCDDNECVRGGGDGEGVGGEGEGEGVGGEGEGAAEGEGVFGEGEGGGEGEGTTSCSTACTCAVGESCIGNVCTPFANCFSDAECPRANQQCTPQICDFFAQTCSDAPAGEGEGEGAAGEGEGEGGNSCTTFLGSGAASDCDCGCGAHDSDCATSTGCDTGGCGTTAQGCDFCWSDVNNQLSACPP